MAFVVESKRLTVIAEVAQGSNYLVGPGSYDPGNQEHKETMKMIFPKKQVPFNNHEASYQMLLPKNTNPGPGAYKNDRSDF